jgi:hypothetical protein
MEKIINALPQNVKQPIVTHAVEVGFEATPWQDDCCGSKSPLTGHGPLFLNK